MIIFLYGPDTFRSKQKLNEIIEHYKKIHKSGLSLKYFDFKEDRFEDFRDAFKSSSMFKEKKLLVLKNLFSDPKITENFLKNFKEISKSKEIILIFEKEVNENHPLVVKLKKEAKIQRFNLLEGIFLENWVKKEFQKYGAKISPDALEKLVEFVGSDLWQMENEIKKLVNYNKGEIKKRDVELLVKPKIETDIFQTIDALVTKNKKRTFTLIKKHLEKGDSPTYLLSMINFQFRNLLLVKSLVEEGKSPYFLQKTLDIKPFLIKKSYFLAQKFTLPQLKKIYQKIFEADLNIKTGKLNPETALDLLISQI